MTMETDVAARLEDIYVPMFERGGPLNGPMSPNEARELFEKVLEKAREKSSECVYAKHNADTLLALVEKSQNLREDLEWKRAEGVQEEDFRQWWNMHDLERHFVLEMDNLQCHIPVYLACRHNGASKEEAQETVWKIHPRYALSRDTIDGEIDDDSPLPIELKDRVNRWGMRQMQADPTGKKLRERKERSTSMNAIVREEIRKGTL